MCLVECPLLFSSPYLLVSNREYSAIPFGKQQVSIHGVQYRLNKHRLTASKVCASLKQKRVTVHRLRHTMAMDLLPAGVDRSVIALWLGHESVDTTQIYSSRLLGSLGRISRTSRIIQVIGKPHPDSSRIVADSPRSIRNSLLNLAQRDAAVERFSLINRQLSGHGVTKDTEFPVVFFFAAGSATQRAGLGLILTSQCAHEFGCSINDFVAINAQLPWVSFIRRDLIENLLVVAWGIGNGALGFALPRTEDGLDGLRPRWPKQAREDYDQEQWVSHGRLREAHNI